MKMSVWSLACQQSVFQRYQSEKHLSVLPTIWRRKLTRIEITSLSPYVCLTPMRLSDKVVLNAYSPLKLAYSYLSCQKDTASQLLRDVCINAAVLHSQSVCPTRTHASLIQLGGGGKRVQISSNPFHTILRNATRRNAVTQTGRSVQANRRQLDAVA